MKTLTNNALGLMMFAGIAIGTVHCSSPSDATKPSTGQTDPDKSTGADDNVDSTSQAVLGVCWAQIERPIPADTSLALGTSVVLKTGGEICPDGEHERLAYRYYVEKVDQSGNIIAPRVSPQGATGWSFTRSTFDTTDLPGPGRYRIYAFSLPRTMVSAWQANDSVARNRSQRSGNAYTYFTVPPPATSWSTGDWGTCSQVCDGGSQTRTVTCVDSGGTPVSDAACSDTKPDDYQACNTEACDPGAGCGAAFGCHVSAPAGRSINVSFAALRSYQAEPSHAVVRMDTAAARSWLHTPE